MRIHYPRLIAIGVILLTCIIGGVYYFFYTEPQKEDAASFREEYALTLRNYEGAEVHLAEYKRKLLVIHSWASWCTYCAEELRNLARLKEIYGDDVQILAVNRAEPEQEARAFTDALQLGDAIVVLLDPDDTFYKEIEGYAMPETLFIRENGDVLFHQRGPMKVQEVIEKINQMEPTK